MEDAPRTDRWAIRPSASPMEPLLRAVRPLLEAPSFAQQMQDSNGAFLRARRAGLPLGQALTQDIEAPMSLMMGMVAPTQGSGIIVPFTGADRWRRSINLGFSPERWYRAATRDIGEYDLDMLAAQPISSPHRQGFHFYDTPTGAMRAAGITATDEGAQILPVRIRFGQSEPLVLEHGTPAGDVAALLGSVRSRTLDPVRMLFPSGERVAVVFRPRDIRSVNADFHPQRASSANLLAGHGAGGLLSIGAMGERAGDR